MTPLLAVQDLTKRYRRPGIAGLLGQRSDAAVRGASLRVEPGERVGLIGESGSGKTTLVRAALGLLDFDEGHVELLGRPLEEYSREALRALRGRCQLLVQSPDASLNPGLTVRALLRESARLHRPDEEPASVVAAVAARVGLTHRLDGLPHQLSGGEKRRVGIARLLIADPDLIVADEPTAGLDASLKAEITDLLLANGDPSRAHLIISHDLALVAYACQRVAVMHSGMVVEEVRVADFCTAPHHPYLSALLSAAGLTPASRPALPIAPAGRAGRGCPYAGPCPWTETRCAVQRPVLTAVVPDATHRIACHVFAPGEDR